MEFMAVGSEAILEAAEMCLGEWNEMEMLPILSRTGIGSSCEEKGGVHAKQAEESSSWCSTSKENGWVGWKWMEEKMEEVGSSQKICAVPLSD